MQLPTYAGDFSYFLDAVLYQGGLQELDRLGEDGFFVVVAVEQQIVNFRADRGAGMLQIVRQKIVCGDVQGIGDHDQHFQTGAFCTCFNVAHMPTGDVNDLSKFLLGHLFICSISLNALAYTFVVEGHRCTFLSVRPAIGSSILASGFAHSNLISYDGGR